MKYLYAYRNISLPANVITIICCYVAWDAPSGSGLSLLPWVKVVTSMVLIAYIYLFRSSVLYFYMNLGMSKQQFYSSLLLIDIVLFAFLFVLTILLK